MGYWGLNGLYRVKGLGLIRRWDLVDFLCEYIMENPENRYFKNPFFPLAAEWPEVNMKYLRNRVNQNACRLARHFFAEAELIEH